MRLPKHGKHGVRAYLRFGYQVLRIGVASRYRGFFRDCRFIGVTGSCGKTTTKELIGAILTTQGPCLISYMTRNIPTSLAGTLFNLRSRHRFCVHELGASEPGMLARMAARFRPHIGVVTQIGYDHYSAFRSLEATAKEKTRLVEALPADGIAVLNADDPRVLAMREQTRARVVTYGLSEEAMVRGEEVFCAWPETLSLYVRYEGTRLRVQTQLLGEHWATAVLAALATGLAMGVPLPEAVEAVRGVPPVFGRLSPHPMAEGVTFVQDLKAALYMMPASLRFLETAQASRKIAIIGTISDYPGESARKYRRVAQKALEVADRVFFVGRWAHYALKARPSQDPQRLQIFKNAYELRHFLRDVLAPGDLVLAKSSTSDHLERLVLGWEREFPCWRHECKRLILCTECPWRHYRFLPVAS